jgi:hypothetical protein
MGSPKGTLTSLQIDLAHAFLSRAPGFFLTGGAVLAGWELKHRTTDDLDFFTDSDAAMKSADANIRAAAAELGAVPTVLVADPDFRRLLIVRGTDEARVDLVRDRAPQLLEKVVRDGLRTDSVDEIFANKICALVGRSEARDLVDIRALEEKGLRVEDSIPLAAKKDGGVTPATLAWLLGSFVTDDPALATYAKALEGRMLAMARPA